MIKNILLSTCIALAGCASQKKTFTTTEKIDIKHVKEMWSATPKASHHQLRSGDTIVRLGRIENDPDQINIVEEIASSKDVIKTQGRISEGLTRLEYNPSDPKITRKYYFPSGQLSWVEQFYSEKYLKDRFAEIEYPIGEIFQYNESGVLIKHERIDELIAFNFDKVKQIVLEMNPNAKITVVRLNGDIHKSPIWNINYVSVDNGLSALNVDSQTGEIISQGHNIKMYE